MKKMALLLLFLANSVLADDELFDAAKSVKSIAPAPYVVEVTPMPEKEEPTQAPAEYTHCKKKDKNEYECVTRQLPY